MRKRRAAEAAGRGGLEGTRGREEMEAKKAQREVEAKKAWRDAEAEEAQRTAEAEAEKQWRDAEAEEAWRKAEAEEAAWKDAEMKKKAKVSATQRKQLELLSQCKVTVQIAWEEEAQRVSEAGREAMPSRITGYRKGKVPEKQVCMNCLRRGIECKWDEGGQGKSKIVPSLFY